jgi:hypothetical protein
MVQDLWFGYAHIELVHANITPKECAHFKMNIEHNLRYLV